MEQELKSFLTHRRSEELKAFVGLLDKNPELLNMKELSFLKDFIVKLGGKIPEPPKKQTEEKKEETEAKQQPEPSPKKEEEKQEKQQTSPNGGDDDDDDDDELRRMRAEEEREREEPDPELMESDAVEGCSDIPMGDASKECSDEDRDEANRVKGEALAAQGAGNAAEALRLFSAAIERCPRMAVLYAARASLLLAQRRPNAAIRDCDAALRLNPDSAKAYKVRGKAYRYLGAYEKAKKDLQCGNRLDFDDATFAVQKFVEARLKAKEDLAMKEAARARQREEARREKERDEIRRRREEAARQAEKDAQQQGGCGGCGGCPGGCGGCGGCPGGAGGLPAFLNDPEIIEALNDPVTGQKLMQALQNPAMLGEAMKDPKLAKIIQKIVNGAQGARTSCHGGNGGGGGMPGGMPGGFGGMGGMGGMPGFM